MKVKYRIKLILQFIKYILFAKNNFKISKMRKMKLALSGFTVDQYYLYGKRQITGQYLSEYDWFKSRLINKPYEYIINDKLVFNELVKDRVKTPDILVVKYKGTIKTTSKSIYNEKDIFELMQREKSVIFKPIFKGKGNDVLKLSVIDNEFFVNGTLSNKKHLKTILEKKDNWMICEQIENHAYAKKIYPETLNTIRVVVIKENREPVIAYAIHRFGTSQTKAVDNASRGGLVSKIDLEEGVLSEAKSIKTLNVYDTHPDTGNKIQGVSVPYWDRIKSEVLELSKDLFYFDLIAWDIAVAEKDIYVIEGNSSSGVNILQLWEGQKNSIFGQFLRRKGVIR